MIPLPAPAPHRKMTPPPPPSALAGWAGHSATHTAAALPKQRTPGKTAAMLFITQDVVSPSLIVTRWDDRCVTGSELGEFGVTGIKYGYGLSERNGTFMFKFNINFMFYFT